MSEIRVAKTSKFAVLSVGPALAEEIKVVASTKVQPKASKPDKAVKTESKTTVSDDINIILEQKILSIVAQSNEISDTWDFAATENVDHQIVVGVLKSLLSDRYVIDEPLTKTYYSITPEGESIALSGSPEYEVYDSIPPNGILMQDLQKLLGESKYKVGFGPCMKNKWIKKDGERLFRLIDNLSDETAVIIRQIMESPFSVTDENLKNMKRRKLINEVVQKSYRVLKGSEFRPVRVKKLADISKEMLGNKSEMEAGTHWSDFEFKAVNLKAIGLPPQNGSFHPLLKVRAEFRRILMEMGFEEMPTSRWVESSFWNFDALFQPQSHPARDAHDTFFMKDPKECNSFPEDYYERVKATHENGGGFDSIGYGCNFKREEATKNLLRTHTTAISAQMLYKLANQEGGFTPKRYFSIDRVFRNEAMDATHLCEFHQVEGLIADRNLTLGNLIGTIKLFFEKIGITQLRFKPAYNPYTEPSMEIFGYHPELKKWTEIGNSGMFRPEMLRPMGLPEDVRVIAWGLSLERPTMIKYHIENIRDLFGHKADLLKQRNAPIARFF